MKNSTSRIIIGSIISILSLWVIFIFGIRGDIDYGTIFTGLFFLILGIFIIFNKNEDRIEKIKSNIKK